MPGAGPPPNPDARRTNNRDAGFTILTEGRKGRPPKLPAMPDLVIIRDGEATYLEQEWSEATTAAWRVWWASPQATQWQKSDVPQLVQMAAAYERALSSPGGDAAKEYRQWADRFGLTPLSRLRNRWLIGDPKAQAAAEAAESTAVRLHAV